MNVERSAARMRKAWLAAVVLLVGCAPAAVPTASVRPPTTAPTISSTTSATAAPTPPPAATPSGQPEQTPSQGAASSPVATDGLGALFGTLAPALAPFNPVPASVTSGEDVIARLEETKDLLAEPFHAQINAEIARYQANGLLERGTVNLGTTPAATLTVDRFVSEAGAAADFQVRGPGGSCDEVTLPGAPLADVIAKRCDAPDANDLYVVAHRGSLIVTAQVLGLPEAVAIEPVVATLVDVLRAIEPSLSR